MFITFALVYPVKMSTREWLADITSAVYIRAARLSRARREETVSPAASNS
jgi:hypothetical protein